MKLIPSHKGYRLSDKTEADVPALVDAIKWITGIILANDRIGQIAIEVKALPEVQRNLKQLPHEDKEKLKRGLRLLGSLVNAVEIEEGFGE